jgi:hypothetical protein
MSASGAATLLVQGALLQAAGLLPPDAGTLGWPLPVAILLAVAAVLIRLTREIATLRAASRAPHASAAATAAREREHGVGGMVGRLVVDAVTTAQVVREGAIDAGRLAQSCGTVQAAMQDFVKALMAG